MPETITRAPRFDLHLPVSFSSSDGTVKGRCSNVSESGMLVLFESVVEVWLVGTLWLDVDGNQFSLKAKSARIHGKEIGMAFIVEKPADIKAITFLVEYARERHQPKVKIGEF